MRLQHMTRQLTIHPANIQGASRNKCFSSIVENECTIVNEAVEEYVNFRPFEFKITLKFLLTTSYCF